MIKIKIDPEHMKGIADVAAKLQAIDSNIVTTMATFNAQKADLMKKYTAEWQYVIQQYEILAPMNECIANVQTNEIFIKEKGIDY